MAGLGIVGLKKLDAEVVSNFKYLRDMAPGVTVQPEFVTEIWSEYPPLASSILSAFGAKSKSINEETKMHMRHLYCRTSKILLEVLFDRIMKVRDIYKSNPSILKDIHQDLSSVEVDYSDISDFLTKSDDLMAVDVSDELIEQTRDILERSKRSEKLLKTYEELIRNAVHVKNKLKNISFLATIGTLLLVVTGFLYFVIPYFIGQPKASEDAREAPVRESVLATPTNGTDAAQNDMEP